MQKEIESARRWRAVLRTVTSLVLASVVITVLVLVSRQG